MRMLRTASEAVTAGSSVATTLLRYLIQVGNPSVPPAHQGTVSLGSNASTPRVLCSYTNVYLLDEAGGAVEVNAINPGALQLLGDYQTHSHQPVDMKISGGNLVVVGEAGMEIVRVINSSLLEFNAK